MQLEWYWLANHIGSAAACFTVHICPCVCLIPSLSSPLSPCPQSCLCTGPSFYLLCLYLPLDKAFHLVHPRPCVFICTFSVYVPTMWNRITNFTLCRCMTTMSGGSWHSLFVGGFFFSHTRCLPLIETQLTSESLQAKFRSSRIPVSLIINWVEWWAFFCTAESPRVVLSVQLEYRKVLTFRRLIGVGKDESWRGVPFIIFL